METHTKNFTEFYTPGISQNLSFISKFQIPGTNWIIELSLIVKYFKVFLAELLMEQL